MQPRLIKANQVEYQPVEWDGKNGSGYVPIGDRVLIRADQAKTQTTGGIFITDEMLERMNLSATSGIIIAMGDDAFSWNSDRTRPFNGARPRSGDHVYFEKYAGLVLTGDDGEQYRIVDDKTIGAVQSQTN